MPPSQLHSPTTYTHSSYPLHLTHKHITAHSIHLTLHNHPHTHPPTPYTSHPHRQHLSSRIIRGRSVSLLLERRLSQTFAHCFPHKSPLQMLEDLQSSQILMDRFCDSELLESLDQLMVQASQQDMVSPVAQLSRGRKKIFFWRGGGFSSKIIHCTIAWIVPIERMEISVYS